DVYDGRGFVKAFFGGEHADKGKGESPDLDVDIRLGAIAGHNGEALRGVDLKMSRRNGQIRTFALNSKLGREAPLTGEVRSGGQRKNVLYFETVDAGALMRFTDIYPRLHGGQMWVAMDVPTPDQAPQDGIINMRDFTIKGESALNGVVGAPSGDTRGVDFTRLRVDFTRTPGKLQIKESEVRGPTVGATVEGNVDFVKNDVRLRGTFVPLYGINNAFGQLPLIGPLLGGQREGLLGITYEVSGPPSAPKLSVNPMSAMAPGLLRKFFEFPNSKPVEPFDAPPNGHTLNVR
ncbi:MAG: AsmA-like C-terminal region-containing protein, partial [Pseudorhodoplanes sp.]